MESEAKSEPNSGTDGEWPKWTNLVMLRKGYKMVIGVQTQQIQKVISQMNTKELPIMLGFIHAFLPTDQSVALVRDLLVHATRTVGYDIVSKCVLADVVYARGISSIVSVFACYLIC
jgi:hypothetical protein